MPRNNKRKTNIGQHTEENMRIALTKLSEGQKIKTIAKLMNIPYTTLYRYQKKIEKSTSSDPINTERLIPNYSVRKIFTSAQEQCLADYLTKCSSMFYGLSIQDSRRLAYEMAIMNNVTVPQKWHDTKLAGIEWVYGFRKRHPILSLRTPEACSLSRAASFNRHNVKMFFDNLADVMSRHESFGNGTRVYNLDETNTMTVQNPAKVFAVKGQKHVSKVTSAERGTLVTTCYIVNATGNTLPPVMIFPRVHFKSHMVAGAPAGTLGLATQSGWMNGELFVETMQHFITHSNSSKANPSLLILDNHESHICIEAINLAKQNGVTILTFPPHSTAKLQPLDVGVFGPLKAAYNRAIDSWMMRNPGKTFSIYDVAACVTEAHMKAMTPNNICNAFKATGIFPYNRDIFTDDDFAPSEVTDRQHEKENELPENIINGDRTRSPSPSILLDEDLREPIVENVQEELLLPVSGNTEESQPSVEVPRLSDLAFCVVGQLAPNSVDTAAMSKDKRRHEPTDSTPSTSREPTKPFVSPFNFRGLPKAGPRKRRKAERRKGKTMIVTDTPNKDEIEQRKAEKNKCQRKKSMKAVKKKILESDSDEDERMSLYSEEEPELEKEDEIIYIDPKNFHSLHSYPNEGNFVLVEFQVLSRKIYYIAKVIGVKTDDIEVSFLRKSVKNPNKFHMPNVPDIAIVALHDIKLILPQPSFTGSTRRIQGLYQFNSDFSKIDLR